MKFRKKPVEIEAEQFKLAQGFLDWSKLLKGALCLNPHNGIAGGVHIHTLEGIMDVNHNDWKSSAMYGKTQNF